MEEKNIAKELFDWAFLYKVIPYKFIYIRNQNINKSNEHQ